MITITNEKDLGAQQVTLFLRFLEHVIADSLWTGAERELKQGQTEVFPFDENDVCCLMQMPSLNIDTGKQHREITLQPVKFYQFGPDKTLERIELTGELWQLVTRLRKEKDIPGAGGTETGG